MALTRPRRRNWIGYWPKGEEEEEEEEGFIQIVHARGTIPNEMGPTHCHATPALTREEEEEEEESNGRFY